MSRSGATSSGRGIARATAFSVGLLAGALLSACQGTGSRDEERSAALQGLRGMESAPPELPEPADPDLDRRRSEERRAELASWNQRARDAREAQDASFAAFEEAGIEAQRAWAEGYRPTEEAGAAALDHYVYGRALLLAQRPSEARYRFELALSDEPGFAVARGALGLWHFRYEEWTEAQKHLEAAWAADKADPEVAFYLAYTYEKLGKPERSVDLMREVLGTEKGEEPAASWLAEYYAEKEEHAEVVRILEPLVDRYPDSPALRWRLAASYEALGRIDAALQHLELLLPQLEGGWRELVTYAELLRRADRFADAERILARVLEEAPDEWFEKNLGPQGRPAIEARLSMVRQEKELGRRLYRTREELLGILRQEPDAEKRAEAAQALYNQEPPRDNNSLGTLVTLLIRDPDPRVKVWAPRVLERWAVPQDTERFLRWIVASKPIQPAEVRAESCEALGRCVSEETADVLVDCLLDEDVRVFHSARLSLQRVTGLSPVVIGDGEEYDEDAQARARVHASWAQKVERWKERRAKQR